MPRKAISAVLLAGALLAAAPGRAQPMSELEESLGRRKTAPVIPPALRGMVRESHRDRLVIRALDGGDIRIDIGQMEPERFDQFVDGRYFGFAYIGYEHFGYLLVDRTMRGDAAVIATGDAPTFSPEGRYFAAVQLSGADSGNLEGFGLWEVEPQGTRQRLFNAAFPPGEDWRIDGWRREDCVALSAAARGEAPQQRSHDIVEVGERIALQPTDANVPCNAISAVEEGDD